MVLSGAGSRPEDDAAATIILLRGLADEERRRAQRAAALADNHEARATAGPEYLRELRTRMARLHRRTERRHRTSAGLQEMHAVTTEAWLARGRNSSGPPWPAASPPALMATVAEAIGVRSATAALHGSRRSSLAASSSDDLARAVHELELAVGEGPAGSAVSGGEPVSVGGRELAARWSLYGPAAIELGVRSVLAVPLRAGLPDEDELQADPPRGGTPQEDDICLGSLAVYGTEPVLDDAVVAATGRMAGAVTRAMLLPGGPLFADADYEPTVHQAAGMVAARCGCGVDDAEGLLRARAFADGCPVGEIARAVLRGEIHLSLRTGR
jgi:hypothetical protein